MKKQIIHISPIQTAKVFALLYFLMSLPLVGFMAITFLFAPTPTPTPTPTLGILIFLPFIYLIIGFIFTALGAWIYNLVAKWVGGIEYTSVEIKSE